MSGFRNWRHSARRAPGSRWNDVAELKEGDPAPDLLLTDDEGQQFRLSDFRGKKVVLYFYPKADTPGCTKEACGFRDEIKEIEKTGALVLGASADSVAKQAKFKAKYRLPFRLIADENHELAEAFGVWKPKTFLGRKFLGVNRETFLIDENGRIAKIFRKVKPAEHPREVLEALKQL